MRTALARLRYFVEDAWDEWKHSPGVNILAVGTLAVALFLAGLVLLGAYNTERRIEAWTGDLRVEVYLRDDATDPVRRELAEKLAAMPGVAAVTYVDKSAALRRFRTTFGDLAELPVELGSNPLPASLEAVLKGGGDVAKVAHAIASRFATAPGVEEIRWDRDWLERLSELLNAARWLAAGIAALVLTSVVFVMASVLRLAVLARRDEIEIMQLVGAAPALIRGPFLLSGMAQGILASVLALAGVEGVRRALTQAVGQEAGVLLELVAGNPLPAGASAILVVTGMAVGVLGSAWAVRAAA